MLILQQQIKEYLEINIIERYPQWEIGTTYQFGDIAFQGHYYYRSVIDDNTGNDPEDNSTQWLRWDVSNRYAQIDMQATTKTTCDASTKLGGLPPYDLISSFYQNRYDTLSLGGVFASAITIEILDSTDAVVWVEYISMSNIRPDVQNWYDYYYIPLPDGSENTSEDFFFRLPLYDLTHSIRVTLTEKSGSSSCEYMIGGNTQYIGDTLYNPSMGLIDYSVKTTDDFGITSLTRRASRRTMDIDVIFDSGRINEVQRTIQDNMGLIVLFIGDESSDTIYEHLLLLGYIEDFTSVINNSVKNKCSISVLEVI